MSKEISRVDARTDLAGGRAVDDAVEHAQRKAAAELSAAESSLVTQSIDKFKDLVDSELDDKLDEEEVQLRLQQVRRRADRWSDGSSGSIDDLARNGYGLVRLWLQLVAAIEPNKVPPANGAIDEIAQETVAQSINLGWDVRAVHTDWDTAFVAQCIGCLPQAYRIWRLRAGTLDAENLEKVGSAAFGNELVESLRRCVLGTRAAPLLRDWGHAEDPLELTRQAFRFLTGVEDQAQDRE